MKEVQKSNHGSYEPIKRSYKIIQKYRRMSVAIMLLNHPVWNKGGFLLLNKIDDVDH